MTSLDDDALDALLGASGDGPSDDGFTAAVMRRVQADEARRLAPTIDAASALAELERGRSRARRERRWRWTGVAVGSALALLVAQLVGASAPQLLGAPSGAALLVALVTSAWVLLAAHAPDSAS